MSELKPRLRSVLVVAVGAALAVPTAVADVDPDAASAESARRGAAYLAGIQGPDGRIPPDTEDWDDAGEALIALVAGGDQQAAVSDSLEYLHESTPDSINCSDNEPGKMGHVVSGLVAAGENPRTFTGTNLVRLIEECAEDDGGYSNDQLFADAIAMLALLAADAPLPAQAVSYVRDKQCLNGGWSPNAVCLDQNKAETDYTALAMSVLAATHGPGDADVVQARQWLLGAQNTSGCWGRLAGNGTQASSCGLAISAVVALGEDPGAAPWTSGDRAPLQALRGLQQSSGAFHSTPSVAGALFINTVQAVPGMAHWSYPVSPPEEGEGTPTTQPGAPRGSTTTTTAKKAAGTATTIGAGGQGASKAGDEPNEPGATSSTAPTRVLGTKAGPVAWPTLADPGRVDIADPLRPGRAPNLVARELDDSDSGVGAAGVLATGAFASAGLGLGTVWWRRRGVGFL